MRSLFLALALTAGCSGSYALRKPDHRPPVELYIVDGLLLAGGVGLGLEGHLSPERNYTQAVLGYTLAAALWAQMWFVMTRDTE